MNVGRSRRQWSYHKRGISLDDNLNCDFTLDETLDEEPNEEESMQEQEPDSLVARFNRLLSCEDMADVHFLVGQTSRQLRIPGHRLVLSVGSVVFKNMFYNQEEDEDEEEEDNQEDIAVADVEPHAFLEFLRHFYTDETQVTKDNAMAVLHLSQKFKVETLEKRCIQYAKHCIDESNCVVLWLTANKYSQTEVAELALKCIERFASTALLSQDFLRLDLNAVCDILRNDWLRINELQLFIGVTRWAKTQCLRRAMCPTRANIRLVLSEAIDLIRFPLMSEEELKTRVQNEGILEDDVLRALLTAHRTWPRQTRPLPFCSTPRAFQRLQGSLLTVQRFQSFDNQLSNRSAFSLMSFSVSHQIFLQAIGVYGPKKACAFYIQISLSVTRSDRNRDPTLLDRIETQALFKCDGSQPIITVRFENPFQIESHVWYDVRAEMTPTDRLTSQMRSKLHPNMFYSRSQELQYYYGTEALLAAKVSTNQQNIIFNFNAPEVSLFSSAPPTPNPPPRPPPPKEYRRPSRIERLKRALSFSEKTSLDNNLVSNVIMPLEQRVITPIGVGRGCVPMDSSGNLAINIPNELECVTNGTLANIIRQLSSLSRFAEDLFSSILTDASILLSRSTDLQTRISRLSSKVVSLDSSVEEVSLQDIHLRKAFKSCQQFDQQVVSRSSIPQSIEEVYSRCDPPPPLNKLNTYRDDGKDGLKFYTDPNYFFELWRQDMLDQTERVLADKVRKVPKKQTQDKKRKVRQPNNSRERYRQMMTNQGEFIIENKNGGVLYVPQEDRPSSLDLNYQQIMEIQKNNQNFFQNNSINNHYNYETQQQHPRRQQSITSRPSQPPPAPPSNPSSGPSTPSRSSEDQTRRIRETLPPPPPPPPVANHEPEKVNIPVVAEPPPPPPPPPSEGKERQSVHPLPTISDLQSIQLKKTPQNNEPKPTDARSDLLAAIREGIKLKRVEDCKQREVEKSTPLHDVASILARRVAIELSDSEGGAEEDDDSDPWDDESEC